MQKRILLFLTIVATSSTFCGGAWKRYGFLGNQVVAGTLYGYYGQGVIGGMANTKSREACSAVIAAGLLSVLFVPDIVEKNPVFKELEDDCKLLSKGRVAYLVGLGIGFEWYLAHQADK